MKKIIAIVLMTLSASAFAWNNGNGYRGGYNGGYYGGWVAPAIVGVAVGAAIARPYYAPPVYVQQPVYIQQSPTYIQQPYPAGYVQQTILDANCNCYRTVLVLQQ